MYKLSFGGAIRSRDYPCRPRGRGRSALGVLLLLAAWGDALADQPDVTSPTASPVAVASAADTPAASGAGATDATGTQANSGAAQSTAGNAVNVREQVGRLLSPRADLQDYFGRELVDEKARAGSEGQGRYDPIHGPLVIYGKLYPELDFISGSGATHPGDKTVSTLAPAPTGLNLEDHQELTSSNSRIGMRGSLMLWDDLKAIYQVETTVNIGGASSLFGSERDTFVGLSSKKYGTIKFGDLDSVYKNLGSDEAIGFNQVASGNFVSTNNLAAKAGYGSGSASSFNQRRVDSLYYYPPSIYGFHFVGQYSPDPGKNQSTNNEFWSYGLRYIKGGFSVAVAQEVHMDAFGGDPSGALSNIGSSLPKDAPRPQSRDEGNRLTLVYHTSDTAVWSEVGKLEYHDFGGLDGHFQRYARISYTFGAEHQFNQRIRAIVTYTHAEDGSCELVGGAICTTSGLNGSQYNAGLTYYLYRRQVSVYGLYSVLDNGKSAAYNNLPLSSDTFGVGERIQQIAAGILVSFAR